MYSHMFWTISFWFGRCLHLADLINLSHGMLWQNKNCQKHGARSIICSLSFGSGQLCASVVCKNNQLCTVCDLKIPSGSSIAQRVFDKSTVVSSACISVTSFGQCGVVGRAKDIEAAAESSCVQSRLALLNRSYGADQNYCFTFFFLPKCKKKFRVGDFAEKRLGTVGLP